LIRITEEPKPIWAAPTGRKYTSSKDKSLIAKSRHACSKAIGLGNAGAAGHVCLGTIASGTGKYEDAVEQFQSAVQLEPSNEDAYIGLGGAYEHLSKTSDAENIYKKIVQLRPKYWRGYHLLGVFFLRQAQYDDAARMFQKVVELTPERFRGYANMGATLLYEAKYAEAIPPLGQSLAIHSTADTYSNLGTAYYYQHRFKEAAQIYNDLGDKGLALEWLGKALRAGDAPGMLRQQPDLDNLHGDARFEGLLNSTGSSMDK
jgi:tetratricopeptide (TPR) repeat protein